MSGNSFENMNWTVSSDSYIIKLLTDVLTTNRDTNFNGIIFIVTITSARN